GRIRPRARTGSTPPRSPTLPPPARAAPAAAPQPLCPPALHHRSLAPRPVPPLAYSRLSFTVTPCTYRAACRSWRVFRQVVDVADAEAFQHVAQPVHVDAEDAGLQLGALALLGGDPGAGGGQHLGRAGPGDAHHAV